MKWSDTLKSNDFAALFFFWLFATICPIFSKNLFALCESLPKTLISFSNEDEWNILYVLREYNKCGVFKSKLYHLWMRNFRLYCHNISCFHFSSRPFSLSPIIWFSLSRFLFLSLSFTASSFSSTTPHFLRKNEQQPLY